MLLLEPKCMLLWHHVCCAELLPNSTTPVESYFQNLNHLHWLHPFQPHILNVKRSKKCQWSNLTRFALSVQVAITNRLWLLTDHFRPISQLKNEICTTRWDFSCVASLSSEGLPHLTFCLRSSELPQSVVTYHCRFRILKKSTEIYVSTGVRHLPNFQENEQPGTPVKLLKERHPNLGC